MILRYLGFPSLLLELALAAGNSSSSISYSTSTLEITSFLTVTAPPVASGGSGDSPTTGSGLAYASSCNQAKLSWVEDRGATYVSKSTFQTSKSSVSYTVIRSGWIETFGPTDVYTLCDGYPRMNASTEFRTTVTTPESTVWSTFMTETEVYRNVSAPTCTIGARECSVLHSQYNVSKTAHDNYCSQSFSDYTGQPTWASAPYPTSPICGVATVPPPQTTTLGPAACMFNYATIQLLYWPVSTVGNHICGNNWTTVEATPTIEDKPNTAVGLNTTFTSPTVYMVMSGAYEVGSNFATGTAINGILPMASDAVSSMCAYQGGEMGPPEAMDYADFDAPIPKSKYLCQPACWTKPDYPQSWRNSDYNITATENLCTTIYDGVYRPALQVPIQEFNSFYANFTNGVGLDFDGLQCSFSPGTDGIFYDPPSALQQVESAAGPSVPNSPGATTAPSNDPQRTPATPANTVPTALPQTTGGGKGILQPTHNPGDGDEDDSSDAGSPSKSDSGDDNNDDDNDNDNNDNSSGDGDGGNDDGSSNNGNNNASPEPPADPSPTQNVGGIIASIIGADPSETGQADSPQDPADPSNQDSSPSGASSDDDGLTSAPDQPDSEQAQPDSQDQSNSPDQPDSQGQSDSQDETNAQDQSGQRDIQEAQPVLFTDDAGATVTATRDRSALILPSATLTPGQETSIPGIGALSVGSEGIVQNGQTVAYPTAAPSSGDRDGDAGEGYIINGQTYTADASFNVVVAPDVTLTAGGSAATVDGTRYSLGGGSSSGDGLVFNGVAATRTDLGGASAGSGSGTVSSGVPEQTGNAASSLTVRRCANLGGVVGLVALVGLV